MESSIWKLGSVFHYIKRLVTTDRRVVWLHKFWNSFRTFWFTHVLCSLMYLLLGHVNLWRQYLTLITTWLDLFYSPSAYHRIVGMIRSSLYRNIQPCYVETNSKDKVFLSHLSTTRIISKQNFRKLISSAPISIKTVWSINCLAASNSLLPWARRRFSTWCNTFYQQDQKLGFRSQ